MKLLTSGAVAALLSAAIGITALTPAVYAQDQAANPKPQAMKRIDGPAARGPGGPGGLFDLGCGPNGAERVEIGLVRLGYRVDLTDQQKTLLDDLKTTALSAQADLADACTAAREAVTAQGTTPNLIDGLNTRIAVQTAQLEAWKTVLPKLETFYDSLTDEQKASLAPRFDRRMGDDKDGPRQSFRHHRDRNGPGFGPGPDGNGPMQPGEMDPAAPMPGADEQAPAPAVNG